MEGHLLNLRHWPKLRPNAMHVVSDCVLFRVSVRKGAFVQEISHGNTTFFRGLSGSNAACDGFQTRRRTEESTSVDLKPHRRPWLFGTSSGARAWKGSFINAAKSDLSGLYAIHDVEETLRMP